MYQTFRATILNGTISQSDSKSPLEAVILHTVRGKHRKSPFIKFLLGELLQCQLVPTLLPPDVFAPLLDAMVNHEPVMASMVEINGVNFDGPYNPNIVATAYFKIPIKYEPRAREFSYEMSMDMSLIDAVRFYWTWGSSTDTSNYLDFDESFQRLYGETVAFEIVKSP
jgi:hypothetical protein